MKYAPELYARALFERMKAGGDKSEDIHRFIRLILKNGDGSGFKKIVQALERLVAKKNNALYVEIESARPLSEKALASLKKGFSSEDRITAKIRPDLVAGVRVVIDDSWAVDATLKRRLEQLFKM